MDTLEDDRESFFEKSHPIHSRLLSRQHADSEDDPTGDLAKKESQKSNQYLLEDPETQYHPHFYRFTSFDDQFLEFYNKFFNDEYHINNHGKNFYISIPWSPQIYLTVRGAENFHIYLWVMKDLSWSQGWYYSCYIFGVSALIWCLFLFYHAYKAKSYVEMYYLVALTLWLGGNFVWMAGEVFHGDDDISVPNSSYVLEAALGWLAIYFIILRPFKLIPIDEQLDNKYEDAGLNPPFSFLTSWREYEYLHTLFWLGKDLSWNQLNLETWLICLVPTLLISFDFIYQTWRTKRMAIDCSHYISQLIWVLGNGVWAMGSLFYIPLNGDDTIPHSMFESHDNYWHRCRWWASWVLFIAFVPILCLYIIWLPLTCSGRIKAADIPENKNLQRESFGSFSVVPNPSLLMKYMN